MRERERNVKDSEKQRKKKSREFVNTIPEITRRRKDDIKRMGN